MTATLARGLPFTVIWPETEAVSYGPLLQPAHRTARATSIERRRDVIISSWQEPAVENGLEIARNGFAPVDRPEGREDRVHVDVRRNAADGAVAEGKVHHAGAVEAAPAALALV